MLTNAAHSIPRSQPFQANARPGIQGRRIGTKKPPIRIEPRYGYQAFQDKRCSPRRLGIQRSAVIMTRYLKGLVSSIAVSTNLSLSLNLTSRISGVAFMPATRQSLMSAAL